jgi:hypothetical protein|tara:strand:+ start:758 stop:985 length:228 start_codon:yes stop_codon:yes gene_type:complete
MTTFEMKIKASTGEEVTQTITNEKSIFDETLQIDIDDYLHNYFIEFKKKNQNNNIELKYIKLFLEDKLIRDITCI